MSDSISILSFSAKKVFLVGAGPGDPGLITIRGAEALKNADVVLYDALVNEQLMDLYAPNAERISVRKRKGQCDKTQEETTALLIELAQQGKTVVRLKGGDPITFGRGAEEAVALRQAEVPFDIVPGISSISAVPSYAGIPITHRDHASSFGVYSAHRKGGLTFSDDQWKQMVNGPDTLIFLMGKTRCNEIMGKLMMYGMDGDTSAAIIYNGTLLEQKTHTGTVRTLPRIVEEADETGPGLIVVGKVVDVRLSMQWISENCSTKEDSSWTATSY